MLEPRFDLAWKEDLSDDSRALMARRFMEVTETLGVLMMAGQPDWRHTDVGVVVVVTPNICKYLLSTILSLDLPPCPLPVLKPSLSSLFSLEDACIQCFHMEVTVSVLNASSQSCHKKSDFFEIKLVFYTSLCLENYLN